jgi:hypothetical protein
MNNNNYYTLEPTWVIGEEPEQTLLHGKQHSKDSSAVNYNPKFVSSQSSCVKYQHANKE